MGLTDIEIDRILRQADIAWNVWAFGQAILWMHNRDQTINMARLERRLRAMGSETYFVARPLSSAPDGTRAKLLDGRPAEHWLWICLQGIDEMEPELELAGLTIESNLVALETTGMLVLGDSSNVH